MTSVINSFTVTNAAIGKFRFNWSISGQTPQKISIIIYSDSGYTSVLYTFSTDPSVSSSGIVDFLVTANTFTMGASNPTLSNATTYYSQIYVIPYGIQTVTTTVYLNNNSNPNTSVYPVTVIPINYASSTIYSKNVIGAYFANGTPTLYMSVLIVNFAIYNRVLSSTERVNYFKNSSVFYNSIAVKLTSFYQSVANFPSYLYFDGDSLNQMQGYFSGSSVATWCNLGSEVGTVINARGAYIGASYLPTLQQTSMVNNNRYYVQFTGTGSTVGNYFTLPPLQMTNAGFTIIFVANIASSAAGYNSDPVIDFGDNINTGNIIIGRNGTSSQLNFSFYNSGGSLIVNQTTTYSTSLDGTWRIYAIRINNIRSLTSYYSWFYNNNSGNGTTLLESGAITIVNNPFISYQSLNYSNSQSASGSFIGRSNTSSRSMSNMQLGEFLLFRNTLSDTSINAIISIMEKRWNLDTPRTNIDFEVTQNVATFPSIDNSATPKTIVANANATMVNNPIRGYVMSQYATISSYNIATSYTKMCWIYLVSSISSVTQIISSANTASSGIHSMFYNSINNISAGHSVGTTQTIYITDPQTTPIGIWTHYTVCYENAQYTMTLYRNGIQVAQVTNAGMSWSGGSANTGVIFGNSSGYLDKPRIYSRALKQTEIQVIFNSEKQIMPVPVYYNSAGSYDTGTITATSSGTPTSSGTTISWTNNNYPAGTSLTISNTNGPNVTVSSITPGTQQTQAITFTSTGSCTLTIGFTNQASVNIYGLLSATITLTIPIATAVHVVPSGTTPTSTSPTAPSFGATYVTFSGSNQYLNFGSIAIPLVSSGLSIKMKLAWTSYNNWARVIDFNNGGNGLQDMFITLPGTTNILRFQYKENGVEQQCDCNSNPISLNTVYNIAIVYDPTIGTIGQVSIWINGTLVTLTDRRTLKGTDKTYANTYIGKSSYGGDAYLAAQVYQLDIYTYPISSTLAQTPF